MTTLDNIIVLDFETNRAKAMLKAFEGIANRYQLIYDNIENTTVLVGLDTGDRKEVEEIDLDFSLVLVHARDKRNLSLIKNYTKRVWYGGNGLFDQDAEKWEMIIRRSILKDGTSALNTKEALQLFEFAKGKIRQIPSFLFYPDKLEESCLAICESLYAMQDTEQLQQFDATFQGTPGNDYWQELKQQLTSINPKRERIDFLEEDDYMMFIDQFRQRILDINKREI